MLLLLCVLAFVAASEQVLVYQSLWTNFKMTHNRTYDDVQDSFRFAIFKKNVDYINELNLKYNPKTYFAVNLFADMTQEEKKAFIQKPIKPSKQDKVRPHHRVSISDLPTAVDWRTKGAVTPIATQGQCGSSPYWSAVVSMEGAWEIAGNKLVALSTQQILDCSQAFGNQGCNGGEMTYSFQYVIAAGGIESRADYPSTGIQGNCSFDKRKVVAKFSSFEEIATGDENGLTEALTKVPVASAVNAYVEGFEFYSSGVFGPASGENTQPDHGIGIVGYGVTSDGQEYYILKNTWGLTWGIQGYMWLARNKKNMCGIASYASYIVV